jgi:antitoxin component YwqK of YwqJK toxin-antitoxin module
MQIDQSRKNQHTEYFKDGGIRAKGNKVSGQLDGYWEWFRKDGTKLRSGHFAKGRRVGEWVTYDSNGKIYKVAVFK